MTIALRPMSTGEILDRTFNLYRNNFVLFAGIAVLPPALMLVVNLIQAVMLGTTSQGAQRVNAGLAAAGGIGMIIASLAYLVGLAVAHAATIFAVSAVHLGRTTSIGESYGRVKGRYGRVVWVLVQSWLRAFWPMVLIFVGFAILIPNLIRARGNAALGAMIGTVLGLGMVAGVIVAIILYLRYSLAVPACVLEDIKATAAIRRSVALSAGARRQIFVVYLLMVVLTYIVAFVFAFPAGMMVGVVGKSAPFLAPALMGLATFFAGALAGPIVTIALSLVYYDRRVRKEAFDLQLLVAAVDGTPAAASAQSAGIGTG